LAPCNARLLRHPFLSTGVILWRKLAHFDHGLTDSVPASHSRDHRYQWKARL